MAKGKLKEAIKNLKEKLDTPEERRAVAKKVLHVAEVIIRELPDPKNRLVQIVKIGALFIVRVAEKEYESEPLKKLSDAEALHSFHVDDSQ